MPTSVMPKGVEHARPIYHCWVAALMPTSVMPKGVEHVHCSIHPSRIIYAHLCDAERR